jgi:hypothetical protein
MAQHLERDNPYQAQHVALKAGLVDYTGVLRLYVTLLSGGEEEKTGPEPGTPFLDTLEDILGEMEMDMDSPVFNDRDEFIQLQATLCR